MMKKISKYPNTSFIGISSLSDWSKDLFIGQVLINITGFIDGNNPPAVIDGENFIVITTGGGYLAGEVRVGNGASWDLVPVTIPERAYINTDDDGVGDVTFISGNVYQCSGANTWSDLGQRYESVSVSLEDLKTLIGGSGGSDPLHRVFDSGDITKIEKYQAIGSPLNGVSFLIGEMPSGNIVVSKAQIGLGDTFAPDQVNNWAGDALMKMDLRTESGIIFISGDDFYPEGLSIVENNKTFISYSRKIYIQLFFDDAYLVTGVIDGNSPPDAVTYNLATFVCITTGGGYTAGEIYESIGGSWVLLTTAENDKIVIFKNQGGSGDQTFLSEYVYIKSATPATWNQDDVVFFPNEVTGMLWYSSATIG